MRPSRAVLGGGVDTDAAALRAGLKQLFEPPTPD